MKKSTLAIITGLCVMCGPIYASGGWMGLCWYAGLVLVLFGFGMKVIEDGY